MSIFRMCDCLTGIPKHEDYAESYLWDTVLAEINRKTANRSSADLSDYAVPVHAFKEHLFREFTENITKNLVVEVLNTDYKKVTEEGQKTIWVAEIVKIAGYRVLLKWICSKKEDEEKRNFWVNIGSKEMGHIGREAEGNSTVFYVPPHFIAERFSSDSASSSTGDDSEHLAKIAKELSVIRKSRTLTPAFAEARSRILAGKLKVGNRIELLDSIKSTRVRPARVKKIVGRRVCVHVSPQDCDRDANMEDDPDQERQWGNDAEFWMDESSFYIFHVGWAAYNGYGLMAHKSYVEHTKRIAEALKNGTPPPYASIDVKQELIRQWEEVGTDEWEVGMKLELMDPLANSFKEMKVASVKKILKDGYLVIQMDDSSDEDEDSVALHCTSCFLFPAGYAEKYGIDLVNPLKKGKEFSWSSYLKKTNAKAAPEILFKPSQPKEVAEMFKKGAKLEASDMVENNLICPATIEATRGRLLQIHYDGWDEEYDQLFDYESCEIFPLGWCEMHGYKLEAPHTEEEDEPKKKKKH